MSDIKGLAILAVWVLAWIWLGALLLPQIESFAYRCASFLTMYVLAQTGVFALCYRFAHGRWS